MKKLIIAEKPSVAKEIASVLNINEKYNGYMENTKYIITWCYGHLVELCDPSHYSQSYSRWSLNSLPFQIDKLETRLIEKTSAHAAIIQTLLSRHDLESVIIATDAGREGELVARWLLDYYKYSGKIERLWISSQTKLAILEGFNNLKDGNDYIPLYDAAIARSTADWFVGLNASRALTCLYDVSLSAGRVQTPTLALLVKREDEIDNFISNDYYSARCETDFFSASYYSEDDTIKFQSNELKEELESIVNEEAVITQIISEEKVDKTPQAYDLTALQQDANVLLNFTAKETLDVLQSLYENHKVVSYPRTDSRYISKDIQLSLNDRIKQLLDTPFAPIAKTYLTTGYTLDNPRFVDDTKVTDHSAIILTEAKVNLAKFNQRELDLYNLIALRFLEVLSTDYKYLSIKYEIMCKNHRFVTRSIKVLDPGYRSISSTLRLKSLYISETGSLPLDIYKVNDKLTINKVRVKKSYTKPIERYTEATLLHQMENAGNQVEDKNLKSHLSRGLGTPATRAEIIEKIISHKYVVRQDNYLVPTAKGRELIRLVPNEFSSAELTAKWEDRLSDIQNKKEKKEDFIKDIKAFSAQIVKDIKLSTDSYSPKITDSKLCPHCKTMMLRLPNDHFVCQKLSCGYEERLVKKALKDNKVKVSKDSLSGKIKISVKPKVVHATYSEVEVIKESKFNRVRTYKQAVSKEPTLFDMMKAKEQDKRKGKRK